MSDGIRCAQIFARNPVNLLTRCVWRADDIIMPKKKRRSLRPSLLVQFGLLSFVSLAAVGVALGNRLQQNARERILGEAVHSAQLISTAGIQPLLSPADLQQDFVPLSADKLAALDMSLHSSISANGIVRLKIWNLQHWIVYSDNPRLIGRWFAGEDQLDAAFDGKTVSEVSDLKSAEELEERAFGRLLSVYVPLRIGPDGQFTSEPTGTVVGAFELYMPYAPIAATIAHDTRQLYLALAVGLLVIYLILFRLVAGASRRLRRQARDNEFLATHDALTGLANRRLLEATVETLLEERKQGGGHVALALFDLDRFKEINDTLGHQSGDDVLVEVAKRLAQLDAACVSRLGGDEFVVVSTDVDDGHGALLLCDRIEQLLEAPVEVQGIQVGVRGSLGLAVSPFDGADCSTLLQHADVAMYVAKRSGTTRRMYSAEFDHYSPERLGLAVELRGAIESGQIGMVYQPKLHIESCEIRSVEALVRWYHPERGMVPPNDFLPLIENTELIGPLTWHVLDLSLAQCAAWRRAGIDVSVAVNLSARTLGDVSLVDNVRVTLARYGLPATALELELTESALLDDHQRANEALVELRKMGVTLSVDDFGTGYASIGYLTNLPIDVLKIDQSFVFDLLTDARSAAVVRCTIDLARQLGLQVVAEGVEDEATLAELHRLGCDDAQGYLIARPMPAEQLGGRIGRWYAATRNTPTPAEPTATAEITGTPMLSGTPVLTGTPQLSGASS
ncbi:MAG: eal and ggdef domain containing protein [Ilumatobacteraceae bacterium]|nr:eal and ggdef domain containing protein [Ilumatobacteraceae bacterium]